MNEENIRDLLTQLHQELRQTDEVEPETLELVRKLDRDFREVIHNAEDVNSPLLQDAISLEAIFAVNHPLAEKIIRELINSLGRMGI